MTADSSTPDETASHNHWLAVNPAYRTYLRIRFSLLHAQILVVIVALALLRLEGVPTGLIKFLGGFCLISFAWCNLVLVPRKFARLQYCVRPLDVNLQSGYLFWKAVSVSINRVQHIEVTQGPIQRWLGIAELSVYTAGTTGSDLKIPGLAAAEANNIKSKLLNLINSEEQDDDAE